MASNLNHWKNTTSTLSPKKIIKYNNNLIGTTSGGLIIFDIINQRFDKYDNDYSDCVSISDLEIDLNQDLWVLCENGIVFKENSSLSINHLDIDYAYDLAIINESLFILYIKDGNYGIIKINHTDNEISFEDYYEGFAPLDTLFNKILILNNIIYVLTDEGVYYGDLNDNLKFTSNWTIIENSIGIIDILNFNDRLIFLYQDEIKTMNVDAILDGIIDTESVLQIDFGEYISSFNNELEIYILTTSKIISINNENSYSIFYEGNFENSTALFIDESNLYIGSDNQGFWFLDTQIEKCCPNTLISSDIEAISYDNGLLYGVSRDGVFIYNSTSFTNLLSDEPSNSFLTEQGDCNYFQGVQLNYIPGNKISSSLVSYDNKVYVPNSGILPDGENKGGLVIIDSDNLSVSSIIGSSQLDGLGGIYYSDINNGYLTINQIVKDNYNKIWVVNPYAETTNHILLCFDASDNVWGHIEAPNNTSYLPQEIAFDQWNRIWVAFRNESTINGEPYSDGGIKLVTPSGNWLDIDNLESLPGDDPSVNVWSLAFGQFEGNDILWLLTSNGVQGYSVSGTRIDPIYPIDFFTNIPFSKGDKIRVDSQNNVWITTSHSGVRVIKNDITFWPSSEGITTENSSILSNVVRDIAFDYENGRVFFATDKGISELGVPFKENNDNVSIGISPNPFIIGKSDFLTIDNIYSGSKVKIMTVSGMVAHSLELPYNENRLNWDGRGKDGQFLDSGIYFVVIENSKLGSGVSKLAIIK